MDLWCSFSKDSAEPDCRVIGVSEEERRNRIAMNTTAELAAIETVIVLGAVILLVTVSFAWVMFRPLDEKQKKHNSRKSVKRKR